jgi:hypothetical protein
MGVLGKRSVVAIAIVLAVTAFAGAFLIARSAAEGPAETAAQPAEPLPVQPVTINNLERAPSIKPLRSVAGEPAPGAPATAVPAPEAAAP